MTPRERASITDLYAYRPVEQEGLNLSDNSNLFEPNPAIQEALDRLTPEAIRGYPSGYGQRLCDALAERHGTSPAGIVTANGSSDLMDLLIRTFTDPGSQVAYHPPSFSMIPLWSRCNAVEPLGIPLRDGFDLDVDGFANAPARVGFLCRPNNPTGNAFPLEDVDAVAQGFEGLLVLDEAYISFSQQPSAEGLLEEHDHVVLLRSLSKDAGLAGIRFGYAVMAPELAEQVRKVRGPFRVPRTTEEVALAALDHPGHVDRLVKTVQAERERVVEAVRGLGLAPFPTETNFVLIDTPWPGARVAEALAEQGVLVRAFSEPELGSCIRATVGPPEVNDTFLEALEAVLDGGGP